MFILVDNDVKIFGVFDGHGIHGHRVSSFACGKMLDYVRNGANGFFRKQNLMKESTTKKEIKRNIKRCFKFVQGELKAMYRESLKENSANAENFKDMMSEKTYKSPRSKDDNDIEETKAKSPLKPMKSILFEHSSEEDDD
jgi:serine/threonine protein phosphatase PrpC